MKHRLTALASSLSMALWLSACGTDATLTITGSTSATAARVTQQLATLVPMVANPFRPTAAGNVSSVKFTVQSIYVSTSTDCSNPVLVADLGAGTEVDMVTGPTLFTGTPPDGSYVCVMVGMKDIITWRPDSVAQATNAGCDPNVEDSFDIYRTDSGEVTPWKTQDGSDITATGSGSTLGPDNVFIFASTDKPAMLAGATAPNTHQTAALASGLTVPGSAVFYADFTGQVEGDSSQCGLEGVTFGFR
jgi:hypothetical protein